MSTTTVHTPDPYDDHDHRHGHHDGRESNTGMPDATIVPMPRREHGPESQPTVVDGEFTEVRDATDPAADPVTDDSDTNGDADGVREPLPVDLPERSVPRSLDVRVRDAANGQRRSVIAPWLRSRTEFTQTAKWAADHTTHVTAYHTVRLPLYASKLALRAPWGACKAIGYTGAWMLDIEGSPLRQDAVRRGDGELYLKLARERSERVRGRIGVVVFATIATIAGVLVLWGFGPVWAQWLAVAAVLGGLGWLGTPSDKRVAGRAVVTTKAQKLTSDVVVRALASLGIAQINQAVAKGGTGITFPAPIVRDGPGWLATVDLPYGVVVTDIMERRDKLASGLRRPLGCVWPEPESEEHAGRLRLWVGDQDMSQAKPAPWTLAKAGKADIFAPVPFGADQRGRAVSFLLMFANLLIGAMPRQGKTFALRIVLLAAALDPSVQLRIFELKGTGDLSGPGEKCAHHYGTGADDATLEACLESLREVKRELDTRAKTIRELPREVCPENKVTPELARRKGLGLHPVVFAIDECQELFSHPKLGQEAADLCVPIIKRGPALGIMLVLATQRPDAKSLPPAVADNMALRFCLRVMGQVANDMVLGTSAYKNGIRATMFGHKDKGIGLLVGNADDPQITRSAYVDGPDADKIADRARAMRAAAGTLTGYAAGEETLTSVNDGPNLLADLCEVLPAGQDKVWSETVVDRLADLRPEIYGPWAEQDGKTKSTQLAAALKPYGITTSQTWGSGPDGKSGNRRGIARADVLDAYRATQRATDTAAEVNGE
ncbi:MAG: cell division protein FtsK [Actinophytocola sp.]|uniref:cell division protein FtsK n=1 Tax=Actinophytocola sp. TaxID=1872138 RepID=UPI003D6B4B2E